jgi:hypothetical protein
LLVPYGTSKILYNLIYNIFILLHIFMLYNLILFYQ